MALQMTMEMASTLRRDHLSASLATGTPRVAKKSAKANPARNPMAVSEAPNSALIGSKSIVINCRSMKAKT